MTIFNTLCPICDAPITLTEDTVENELIECGECFLLLEVESVNPFSLVEAPEEEEDWGE